MQLWQVANYCQSQPLSSIFPFRSVAKELITGWWDEHKKKFS
ncbi:hypothetical protein [Brasilonema octagenarum]|nr:hypothetical protein [Brasilonema octagenarum]